MSVIFLSFLKLVFDGLLLPLLLLLAPYFSLLTIFSLSLGLLVIPPTLLST